MYTIRNANKEDVPVLLKLIKDLATYEKEPNSVKTTEEDLIRDGFGDNPLFSCLVGQNAHGEIHGFAIYFLTWSTWEGRPSLYLEDLYVKEQTRGQGLGLLLFKNLGKIAIEKGCRRFEWAVLDWNQPALDFYNALGANHKKDWLPYRIEGKALQSLAKFDPST